MPSQLIPGEVGPLHVETSGAPQAPPVLLVHGMSGNTRWWDGVLPFMSRDFFIAALDFRGHGDSGWARPPRYEIGDFAQDIESARRHFGWERFHLAAHSMGARASLQYAAERPERVAGLVLVDFLTDFRARASRKFRRPRLLRQPQYSDPETMLARFRLEPHRSLLGPEALERVARGSIKKTESGAWTWKFDWQAFTMVYLPIWALLPRIAAPALIVRGEHSDVMPREAFQRVLRELPGSRGLETARAFHHVPLDTPAELGEAMAGFLRRIPVKL